MTYQLVKKNKVIFTSDRKIDAIFEHLKHFRSQRVIFREIRA